MPTQSQSVAPTAPQQPTAPQATVTQHTAPVAPPTVAPVVAPSATVNKTLTGYVLCAVAFCVGYLAPWFSLSLLGSTVNSGGQMGLEFLVFLCAAAAACLSISESFQPATSSTLQLRMALSAACAIFAGGELVYVAFMLNVIQLGFGLPLMLVAACAMAFMDLSRLPQNLKSPIVPLAILALLATLAWSTYRGYGFRKNTNLPNIFAGGGAITPGALVDNTPKPRTDVSVKLNTTSQADVLHEGKSFGTYKPDTGKVFLICNVTVTYQGKAGSLEVRGGSSLSFNGGGFQISADNKQMYRNKTFMSGLQSVRLINATLLPGGTTTGDIVFEVEPGVKPDSIDYY